MGEDATRNVWVCGPRAYVVVKALAFDLRGENKEAYDLFYVVRNLELGVEGIAACMGPILGDEDAQKAITILRRDFVNHDGVGARRTAEFLAGAPDDAIQADVVGFFGELLHAIGLSGSDGG